MKGPGRIPAQFLSRAEVRQNPVTGMRGGGAFNMTAGSWSDDSPLSLCLMESLTKCGYDLRDIQIVVLNGTGMVT